MSSIESIQNEIDKLVINSREALKEYRNFNQEKIDKIVESMAQKGYKNSLTLAQLAVEETKRGNINDKVIKNEFATKTVWEYIKNKKTVGIIGENSELGCIEIADPLGVIAGITPVTNPTSTVLFKSIISVKTRNPIIFAFHPNAQKCSVETAKLLIDVAIKCGSPKYCIQWIETPSIEATTYLMNHSGVDVILATGGSQMVKAAYSTGKPALGVGSGNVPCYIEQSADIEKACQNIIKSKTFDNGMICASEQSVVVDKEIYKKFESTMTDLNCYFLNNQETKRISKVIIGSNNKINTNIVGKTAFQIAKLANINIPDNTKIILIKSDIVGEEYQLSQEKLSPILTYYIADTPKIALDICQQILEYGGLGHSASIHSDNKHIISEFAIHLKASRIICNSPSSQGAIGGIYNRNIPSLTLGCGSYGRNSTTDNISIKNLVNIKRVF